MIKAGLIGVGHLGKIHLNLLKNSKKFKIIGYNDLKKHESISNVNYFHDVNEIILKCEAIFICTNTPNHYSIAKKCIENKKHVFIEKPITNKLDHAEELINIAKKHNIIGQVGHVERFNPAFFCLNNTIEDPKFIECHRLAEFNPRGNDVSVILDLMIHDIDIVLSIVKSKVINVKANGVCVINESPDICNARVEFENGCIANFTASRISLKNMRKSRFFQKEAYISVDFYNKNTEVVKIKDADLNHDKYAMIIENNKGIKKEIFYNNPEVQPNNAINEEHEAFAKSILNNEIPVVSFEDGYNALKLAQTILKEL